MDGINEVIIKKEIEEFALEDIVHIDVKTPKYVGQDDVEKINFFIPVKIENIEKIYKIEETINDAEEGSNTDSDINYPFNGKFPGSSNAFKHEETAETLHDDNIYNCDNCGMNFVNETSYIIHACINGNVSGNINSESEKIDQSLLIQTRVYKNTVYEKIRNKIFNVSSDKNSCESCNIKFKTKYILEKHLKVHASGKIYTCDKCHKSFATKQGICRHMPVHTNRKYFKCDMCDAQFKFQGNFLNHSRKHCHKCEKCDKSFKNQKALKRHKKSHVERKPLKCEQCNETFKTQLNLEKHSLKHGETEVQSFKCELCQRVFKYQKNLDFHLKICKEMFKCSICKKGFSQQYSLRNHRWKFHEAVKLFTCKECHKSYILESHLKDHLCE